MVIRFGCPGCGEQPVVFRRGGASHPARQDRLSFSRRRTLRPWSRSRMPTWRRSRPSTRCRAIRSTGISTTITLRAGTRKRWLRLRRGYDHLPGLCLHLLGHYRQHLPVLFERSAASQRLFSKWGFPRGAWSFEPLTLDMRGDILNGLRHALLGCREGDEVRGLHDLSTWPTAM